MIVNVLENGITTVEIIQDNLPNTVEVLESPASTVIEVVTAGPIGPKGDIGPAGPPGSAVLSGGTNNFIPLWSGSTALTSSIIRQTSGTLQISGSTSITGSLNVTSGITGSLFGTSSWAISASRAISSSNSLTASYVNPLNQNVIITGSLTVGSPAVSASNITFTNPGIGGDTRFTFSKTNDSAWLSVVEREADRTYYEFGMSDNPTGGDYFQWKIDNYEAPSLGWMPLQIGAFTNRFVASSNLVWGNFSIPINTAFSTVNNSPTTSSDYQVTKYTPTNSTTQTLYKDSGTGTGTVTLNAASYTGPNRFGYWIVIDTGGTTFTWGNGPTSTTPVATGVVITGAAQTLSGGVTVTLSLTGHAANDRWSFMCFPRPTSAIGGSPVSTAMQTIYPAAGTIGQVIKGESGQTSNLQEWQNSSGTVLAKVDALGAITAPSFTGSLQGTASNSTSASYALASTSASYALSSSYSRISTSASYAETALNILGGKAPHIPYFDTDTTLATSSLYQSGSTSVIINQDNNTVANPEALYVWQPHPTSINVISGKGNVNNYLQLNIQNTNQGINASSDVVATSDNGNETSNYIDMGINSENYNSGFIGDANDAYLYSTGKHLHIGNASDEPVMFFAGGSDVDIHNKLILSPNNQHQMTGSVEISGSLKVNQGITGSLFGSASYAETASYAPLYLPLTGGTINGNVTVNGTASITFLNVQYESASVIYSSGSNVFGDATNDTQTLVGTVLVSGSQRITGSLNVSQGITGSLFGTASYAINAATSSNILGGVTNYIPLWNTATSLSSSVLYQSASNIGIGTTSPTYKLDVAGTTRLSGSLGTISGSILTVVGSGSNQPIFTVQGSQGELFSVTDSLSGSLFSVNDISGLPVLEVFSDNTTLVGNYQAPALITTAKKVLTNSGSFTVYAVPTSSYDGAFFEYTIRSGSNARAGQIMAMWSGSSVNYTEMTTTNFGTTSGVTFGVFISGSNMVLTGSASTSAWTVKSIVRSI